MEGETEVEGRERVRMGRGGERGEKNGVKRR